MYRLGYPEGAAVSDSSRRLIGICAVHFYKRTFQIIRTGGDVEQAGWELGWIRGAIGVAMVCHGFNAYASQPAVFLRSQLGGHMIIAAEGARAQVFGAVLDPFHRRASNDRGSYRDHITGIYRHLPAKTAANVWGDHADLFLRQPQVGCYQGENCPDGMRRLGRHPHSQMSLNWIPLGDTSARLDGRNVDARNVNILLYRQICLVEDLLGFLFIAPFPMPDVVVILVVAHFW